MNAGITGLVTVSVSKATKSVSFEDLTCSRFCQVINIWAELVVLQVAPAASGLM